MAKLPPVPPENRSPKGTGGSPPPHDSPKANANAEPMNPQKHGQQGNTKQNTTNQGFQQDR